MAKRRDTPQQAAFGFGASQSERVSGLSELQQNHRPDNSEVRKAMDFIMEDLADQNFRKAIQNNVVPFPGARQGKPGMQSVEIDDWQITIQGQYMEKPGVMGFEMLRATVEQTPILSAVIQTRVRQVQQYCQVQDAGEGPGYVIRHKDKKHQNKDSEAKSIVLLQDFMGNCGWEDRPRKRRQLHRDSFTQFAAKVTRDTLILDAAAIETEWKKDKKLGIDGFYAVDGGSIRLCTEKGYEGDDEIFALQIVQGQVRTAYTYEDLIYEPRNPRSDIASCGYGMSEVEMVVKLITGYLNALTANSKYFDSNTIPRGLLHLTGNYSQQDIDAFKRLWNAQVKGVDKMWALPVMVSKDQESKAAFEKFGVDLDEMIFAKWMTFLTATICAVFGMAPEEINSEGFSSGASSLSGSDTSAKLADSKDKGLKPLLAYFQNLFTDYIVRDQSDQFVFRFTGLDEDDQEQKWEGIKLATTWNEFRAQQGLEAAEGPLGDAPMNPTLIGPWTQMNIAPPEQAGQPGDDQEDFGTVDDDADPDDQDSAAGGDDGADKDAGPADSPAKDFGADEKSDFGKAFVIDAMDAPIVFRIAP